jgi:hypothetical protein
MYIDESVRNSYLIALVIIQDNQISEIRKKSRNSRSTIQGTYSYE